jgi:hypothetical protein
MAILLRDVMAAGIPPSEARIRMSSEDLANAYADLEEDPFPDTFSTPQGEDHPQ